MKRQKKKQTEAEKLQTLQAKWYQRLKDFEFEDIEDTSHPDRPLKAWHSVRFQLDASRIQQEEQERYNQKLDDFVNRDDIDEICGLILWHGNSVLTKAKVKLVLELHRKGLPERKIAERIKRSKNVVHMTLKKAREWMNVA